MPKEPKLTQKSMLALARWNFWTTTTTAVINAAKWIGLAWVLQGALMAMAGKSTSLIVDIAGKLHTDQWVCLALATAGCAWGGLREVAYRNLVKRMAPAMKARERAADPGRSSSDLETDAKG